MDRATSNGRSDQLRWRWLDGKASSLEVLQMIGTGVVPATMATIVLGVLVVRILSMMLEYFLKTWKDISSMGPAE